MKATAIQLLKSGHLFREGPARLDPSGYGGLDGAVAAWLTDKQYPLEVLRTLAARRQLTDLFAQFVVRRSVAIGPPLDQIVAEITQRAHPRALARYRGTAAQNAAIARALYERSHGIPPTGRFDGAGLTDNYHALPVSVTDVRRVPIAVLGAGAAGLLVVHALTRQGFQNMRLLDGRGVDSGIWDYPNVQQGSRNNPRTLRYQGHVLPAAPGSGFSVARFLREVRVLTPHKVHVRRVSGHAFMHYVEPSTTVGDSLTFPIVINALGVGRPAPVSDRRRMICTTPARAGIRWQQQISESFVRRKRLIFIGLGNSTAEMIHQMHQYLDRGVDTDYRVLTHYPRAAVEAPTATVGEGRQRVRVFRDPQQNLVDFQGDLPESRIDYFRALRDRRIVSDVTSWGVHGGSVVYRAHGRQVSLDVDQVYTLIGYRHPPETLAAFGITTRGDELLVDYDGEFYRPGEPREILKGYFGFGAVRATPTNPNAMVIPGMLHALGDLVFGVTVRAYEYVAVNG